MSCPSNENATQPIQDMVVGDTKDDPILVDDSEVEDSGSDSEEEVSLAELKELDEGLSRVPAPGTLVRTGATIDLTIDTSLSGDEDFWDLIKSGH